MELIRLGSKRTPAIGPTIADAAYSDGTDLPNFLSRPLTLLDRVVWIPCGNVMRLAKRIAWWAFLALVALLCASGTLFWVVVFTYRTGHVTAYVLDKGEYELWDRTATTALEDLPVKKAQSKK